MANSCKYKGEVRGKKNACYAFYGSMSVLDYNDIFSEEGTDEDYKLRFEGTCKWSVDSYCNPFKGEIPVELPKDYEEAYNEAYEKYWYYTVQERSAMFQVEVFCCSNDIDDFNPKWEVKEHYINGEYAVSDEDDLIYKSLEIKPDWF